MIRLFFWLQRPRMAFSGHEAEGPMSAPAGWRQEQPPKGPGQLRPLSLQRIFPEQMFQQFQKKNRDPVFPKKISTDPVPLPKNFQSRSERTPSTFTTEKKE